jgi:hypothetical protein
MENKNDMTWTGSVCCEVLLFFTGSTDRHLELWFDTRSSETLEHL